ncbi:MAG: four-helix bundle copper-binding protein [Myxococcota bacterium]
MHAEQMLRSHPKGKETKRTGLADCIDACIDCAQSCVSCADACIAENKGEMLMKCIRLNQDCGDVCAATAAVLSRGTHTDRNVVSALVRACQAACAACAAECEKHAKDMEHCRICAASCRKAERSCQALLGTAAVAK